MILNCTISFILKNVSYYLYFLLGDLSFLKDDSKNYCYYSNRSRRTKKCRSDDRPINRFCFSPFVQYMSHLIYGSGRFEIVFGTVPFSTFRPNVVLLLYVYKLIDNKNTHNAVLCSPERSPLKRIDLSIRITSTITGEKRIQFILNNGLASESKEIVSVRRGIIQPENYKYF